MRSLFALLILLTVFSSSALAETKIGYVDFQRALLETEDGKKAKEALETMKKARQAKLDDDQKQLKELQNKLQQQKAFMQPDVLQKKQIEFRQKVEQLQMTFAKLQKELAAEEANLTRGIIQKMGVLLADIGKKGGYSVILEKNESRILWAPEKLDLTKQLITRYNAEAKKNKAGPAPKAAPKAKK